MLAQAFMRHRKRLKFMVELRLDHRLQARIDPSDVVQEAYVEMAQRFEEYLEKRPMPLFFWLRCITGQKLLALHRHHLRQARDPRKEVSMEQIHLPEATSAVMAARWFKPKSSPSDAVMKEETRERLKEALEALEALDREVIALRHFEQFTNGEVAYALGLEESAASKRYFRALKKLKKILTAGPGGQEDWR